MLPHGKMLFERPKPSRAWSLIFDSRINYLFFALRWELFLGEYYRFVPHPSSLSFFLNDYRVLFLYINQGGCKPSLVKSGRSLNINKAPRLGHSTSKIKHNVRSYSFIPLKIHQEVCILHKTQNLYKAPTGSDQLQASSPLSPNP